MRGIQSFPFAKTFCNSRIKQVAYLFYPEIHGFIELVNACCIWSIVFDLGDNEEPRLSWSSKSTCYLHIYSCIFALFPSLLVIKIDP